MSEQLVLPILQTAEMTFDNFYALENEEAVSTIKETIEGNKQNSFFIAGPHGVGKTHLLHAAVNMQRDNYVSAAYISMRWSNWYDSLDGLDPSGLICIDDLDKIECDLHKQEIIFHLFNQVLDSNGIMILAASKTPVNMQLELADLASRLSWGVVFKLSELLDEQIPLVLHNLAFDIGLSLSREVINFLLTRCSRKLVDLIAIIKILDKASLSERRRVTVPFVKDVLGI